MWFEYFRFGNAVRAKFTTDSKITPKNLIEYVRQMGFSDKTIKNRLIPEVETIFNSKVEILRKDTNWLKTSSTKASRNLIIRSLEKTKYNYITALRIILDRK